MDIGNWSATEDLNAIYSDIREMGLEKNLAELEAYGFTIIPDALSPELTAALRSKVLEISEQWLGRKLDPENEGGYTAMNFIPYLLYKDKIFKKSVTNPKPLALITYLLGKRCILSSLGCHLKGPGGPGLEIHSDSGNGIPDPLPPYSQVANCNYALTDYSEAKGALAMVPGSHRYGRQPTKWEARIDGNDRFEHVVPIEVPAGSAVVWHGNTWHGSYSRKEPGLRINLSNFYCREYLQPQEDYRNTIPEGFLEPGDDRLARLLGTELVHGWTEEGPVKHKARKLERMQEVRSWYN